MQFHTIHVIVPCVGIRGPACTMGNLVSWHPGKEPLKRQVFPIDLNLGLCFKLDFSHHLGEKNFKKYEFLAILWQIEIF